MDYSERRKAQSRQTEQRILQAALELMRDQGYENVSVRDICGRAGITTGAFYHHFPSKDALISKGFGALDHYVETILERQGEEEPVERLRTVVGAYGDFMEQECGSLTARYYLMRLSDAQAGVRLDPTRFIQTIMVDCFSKAWKSKGSLTGRSPEWAAQFCYIHFRGVVIDWVLSGYSYCLKSKMLDDYEAFRVLFLG